LGGGLEFALACKARIACDNPETVLGMPESKIGLMPGWGGTQRLIECVGLRPGLELLLGGNSVHAWQARDLGLVDQVIATELIDEQLSSFVDTFRQQPGKQNRRNKKHGDDATMDWNSLKESLRKDYNLESPSARAILQAVESGRLHSREIGMQIERQEFFELLQSPEAQACVRRFA
jgi:3-hydroxyacyl-CoA dehydrogenase/enoyl-CoA hydratase/3-hydroxybutyryl-CoA epimerase